MNEEVIRKTNQAVIFRLVFKGVQQIVALCLAIILARILSPVEFGVMALANMIIYYANNLTNLGLNNALVQKDGIALRHINTVFTLDLFISLILAGTVVLFSAKIADFFHNSEVELVLKWMSLYFVISTFYYIPVVILRRDINFRFLSVLEFSQGILTSLIAITLAIAGFSYWALVVSTLVMTASAAAILMMKTRWVPRLDWTSNMREIYTFGLWSFIRGQVGFLVSKADYFVIGRYLDVGMLGVYEKSFELTERAMSGITMPVNTIFFSTFSRLKKDVLQVKQVFLEAVALLALVSYPALFGLIGVAPHFVISCLGEQWAGAVVPIQILAAACVFRVLGGMVASVNTAIGLYKIHTFLNILSAAIFITLCFLFVHNGIVAVSIAFFVFCLISFVFSFWLLYSGVHVTLRELIKATWCPVIGSIVMLLSVWLLSIFAFTDSSSFLQFLVLVGTGAMIYIGWIFLFYKKGVISFRIKGLGGEKR